MYNQQSPHTQDMPKLPLGPEMISLAWQRLSQQMAPWIQSVLVFYVINFGIGLVRAAVQVPLQRDRAPGELSPALIGMLLVFGILQALLQSAIVGGFFQMALNHLRGQTITFGDVFKRTDLTGVLFVTTLLTGLASFFGSLLCLIPGLLLSALCIFAVPLVVDRGLSPMDAISTSMKALKDDMWSMLGLVLLLGLAQLGGMLACGIGLLWTTPLYYLAIAIAYRQYFPSEETPETSSQAPPTILGGER